MINKFAADPVAAATAVQSGDSIAIGGFGRAGIPFHLIDAICERGLTDLHIISNNAGKDDGGIARLIGERRVRKLTCTFPGHPTFSAQYRRGEIELELVPQGTLAERLRCGGAGIPAFYTPTSTDTLLAAGGLPTRYGPDGEPVSTQPVKEVRRIGERDYVLEYALRPDAALVKAYQGDRYGNLRFRLSARNFNPLCAMAARIAIAEVEYAERDTVIAPDDVHLPGVFVSQVVQCQPKRDPLLAQRVGR